MNDSRKSMFFGYDQEDLNMVLPKAKNKKMTLTKIEDPLLSSSVATSGDLFQQNPEFVKLSYLNENINHQMVSKSQKIMFIYHSVLEELHQGCINNDKIMKQEEKLDK